MAENTSYKEFFKNYGIFLLFITVLIGVLLYFVQIANKAWQRNLKNNVEIVLEEKYPNTWSVGNYKKINSPISVNLASYEARNRTTGDLYTAVIIRVTTNYGPLPAVYLIDNENNVDFIGYSSLHGRIEKQLSFQTNNMSLLYWKNRIKDFIK